MKLYEYQAKKLLASAGISIPQGAVADSIDTVCSIGEEQGYPIVIKAQVLTGGRGKAGGVKVVKNASEAKTAAKKIIGMKIKDLTVAKVLIEEALDIAQEYYLGIILDRSLQKNILIFSEKGGIDIEDVAKNDPQAVHRLELDLSHKKNSWPKALEKIPSELLQNLCRAYKENDADLVEINPLIRTKTDKFIAGDAKITIDDNALYRQVELAELTEAAVADKIEAAAKQREIAYVRLDGDIGIVGNGAGLVMCTMDEVTRAGGRPADFLDLGGGSKADQVKSCLELLLMDENLKGIFFNVFGGITRCDEVAKGILQAKEELKISLPMVIRLTGTREKEGKELLTATELIPVTSMQEGAEKIVELTK